MTSSWIKPIYLLDVVPERRPIVTLPTVGALKQGDNIVLLAIKKSSESRFRCFHVKLATSFTLCRCRLSS